MELSSQGRVFDSRSGDSFLKLSNLAHAVKVGFPTLTFFKLTPFILIVDLMACTSGSEHCDKFTHDVCGKDEFFGKRTGS